MIILCILAWLAAGGVPAYLFGKFGGDYYDVTWVQFIACCMLGPIAMLLLVGDYIVTNNKFDLLNQSIFKGKRK